MRYTKNDIRNIPLTEFMAALGEKPVKAFGDMKLTDFMKALGQEHPVAADGSLRIYKAPYDSKQEPTMVVNIDTNQWRDTKSGAYGGIYDLAYELTGSCNMSELNRYIAAQMSAIRKVEVRQEPKISKPKRGMRL